MSEMRTIVRTQVTVNDVGFVLAPGQDVDQLKGEIESAARSGPRFVEFDVVGDRTVCILVSAGTPVMITAATVAVDHGGDPDDTAPFGSAYDLV